MYPKSPPKAVRELLSQSPILNSFPISSQEPRPQAGVLDFHRKFMDLDSSIANLFDLILATELDGSPPAAYFYGVDPDKMDKFGKLPTVFLFYRDEGSETLIRALPREDRFGYFGCLKKMC